MSPRKTYILKLYVAGNTPNSMRALKTLRNILETEFKGVYALKVIDVLKNPQLAEEDKNSGNTYVVQNSPASCASDYW
jgi:circadian clock protein KaiB